MGVWGGRLGREDLDFRKTYATLDNFDIDYS